MDPMIDFVRHRTSDLQRVADDVRRERHARIPETARPIEAAVATASDPTPLAPPRIEPCPPCDPLRPEATAPRAA